MPSFKRPKIDHARINAIAKAASQPVTLEALDLGVDPERLEELNAREKQLLLAYLGAIRSVAHLIHVQKEVPSGHLYAGLCGVLNLETYTRIVGHLKRLKYVTESHYMLKWVGPDIVEAEGAPPIEEAL